LRKKKGTLGKRVKESQDTSGNKRHKAKEQDETESEEDSADQSKEDQDMASEDGSESDKKI